MCLVIAFVGLGVLNTIGSDAGSGFGSGADSSVGSGADTVVGVLSWISIKNILFLKLWRIFSFALINNPTFF